MLGFDILHSLVMPMPTETEAVTWGAGLPGSPILGGGHFGSIHFVRDSIRQAVGWDVGSCERGLTCDRHRFLYGVLGDSC